VDETTFDRLAKLLGRRSGSRRGVIKMAVAGPLAVTIPWSAPNRADGRKRCIANWKTCDRAGGKTCCSGAGQCCLPYIPYGEPDRTPYCTASGNHCCTADEGGGSCSGDAICCRTSPRYPGVNDYCEKVGGECCDDAIGGSCAPGFACCLDPTATPQYSCCPKSAAASAVRRSGQARNFRLRHGGRP
jgi:hypothetical protein